MELYLMDYGQTCIQHKPHAREYTISVTEKERERWSRVVSGRHAKLLPVHPCDQIATFDEPRKPVPDDDTPENSEVGCAAALQV